MRKIKEGKKGQASKYISRAKSIRKLQISLKDFRKMCILKGIYPREPPKKLKKHNRSYYHLKDINFLALDPLLSHLSQQKVYKKKFKRAKAKGDLGKIKYLSVHKPKTSLNHLIRQRYPDFLDALRDLDDPITLISLFSIFPSHKQFGLSSKKIQICSDLMKHLQLYIINSHCLKKAFVSIKGIYYQLQILGVKITFITPYKYPPKLPIDVDYRVMCTFLDFYIVLIKFVLFKLYSLRKLEYPPILKESHSEQLSYNDYQIKPIQEAQSNQKYIVDKQFLDGKVQSHQNILFKNLKFYLSSQVPKYSLEVIINACGGTVISDPNDKSITHYITDRENIIQLKTRQYIQPQWVYDSLNNNRLLSVNEYWVGKVLPPHLSPFVDENDNERYIPQRQKQLRSLTDNQQKDNNDVMQKEKYSIIGEKIAQKKNKLMEEKQIANISKGLISNKNRKLLKVIKMGKDRKNQIKQKLKNKSQKLLE